MKVLVCGDRNWSDYTMILNALKAAGATVVIEGGARGADTLAGGAATALSLDVRVYPADWARYGRAAGPIRNKFQYDEEQPDLVLAFHDNMINSKGTLHMVLYAAKQGCKVLHYSHGHEPVEWK